LWYLPAVLGIWLIFDYISSIKNKHTALQILKNNKKKFIKLLFLMFMLGCTIEIIGRFILNLWIYPFQTTVLLELLGLVGYIFILLSFREMYESLAIIIKNKTLLFICSIILGIIIWEIPNLFIYSWIYTIPYISLEIFKINIIVIIGWTALIGFPVWIYNKVINRLK
jgi:hypothetical protein